MKLKTKYQYTYFIYPYVVKENKYDKYILKLLKNENCKVRIFQKEKDLDIYSYFLPAIRQYMFPTFEFNKNKIKKFEELNDNMKSMILSKYPCTIFEYDIGDNTQGKAGKTEGIFFKIQKIEIICFNTGICFLSIKTNIENSDSFADILDFNYKFKDINSEFSSFKEYENIKIQTNAFSDSKKFSELINDITGPITASKQLNIDTNTFLTFSYTCVDEQNWNNQNDFTDIEDEFLKYLNILPSSYNSSFNKCNDILNIVKWKYIKCGFTKLGSTLLASGVDTLNYTRIPQSYENEYLYTYILALYKKIYMKKINLELKTTYRTEKIRKSFIDFTKELWIQEITNDETGSEMYDKWKEVLQLTELYLDTKNKYDIIYKELNIQRSTKLITVITALLAISVIVNILNFLK